MLLLLLKKIADSHEGMRRHVAGSTCQHSDKASSDFLRNPLGRGEWRIIGSREYSFIKSS